jgi:hypothetical protein
VNSDFRAPNSRVRSSWNESALLMKGPLTDRKIEAYASKGWYSDGYRKSRREFQAKRREKQQLKDGNFFKDGDRMIYSP